jgi:hypothetical protein
MLYPFELRAQKLLCCLAVSVYNVVRQPAKFCAFPRLISTHPLFLVRGSRSSRLEGLARLFRALPSKKR